MHDAERWIIPFSNASYAHLALQNGIGVIQHRIDGVCGISVGRQFEERWLHPEGERVFPFGFLLSLQAKSRVEMAKDDSGRKRHSSSLANSVPSFGKLRPIADIVGSPTLG